MIAATAGELEAFTPPSLANVPEPPVFLIRPATGREMRKFQYRMRAEGLTSHTADAFRAEALLGLKELSTESIYEPLKGFLETAWQMLDQGIEMEAGDAARFDQVMRDLAREWRPLAVMVADNARFAEEAGAIAVAMFVAGWTGLETPYGRESGAVPLEKVDAVAKELGEMEQAALAAKIEGVDKPGLAYVELCNAAFKRLALTGEERKNSDSPSSSPSTPNGSRRKRSRPTGARRSKASASSATATAG